MQKNNIIYKNTFFVVITALLCTALWGSATPFIKTGYQCLKVEGTPSILLFAGIRFALAGLIIGIFGVVFSVSALILQNVLVNIFVNLFA